MVKLHCVLVDGSTFSVKAPTYDKGITRALRRAAYEDIEFITHETIELDVRF
jgi:hypothetical protein